MGIDEIMAYVDREIDPSKMSKRMAIAFLSKLADKIEMRMAPLQEEADNDE